MTIKKCANGDGRVGECELIANHVGYPCRSKTWEWDSYVSQPRQPETPGIWWPVFGEVKEIVDDGS